MLTAVQPQGRSAAIVPARRPLLHLVYLGAIDLRICLLVASGGFDMRPVSKVEAFLAGRGGQGAVVLVDAGHAHEYAVRLVSRLVVGCPGARVVLVSEKGSVGFFREGFRAGAIDVLDKSFDDARIREALAQIAASSSPQYPQCGLRQAREGRFARLTQREKEVFDCLLAGHTNRETGELLGLSPRTVELHRARVHDKLQVRNVAHLAREYGFLYQPASDQV